jgi:hypothetical protein
MSSSAINPATLRRIVRAGTAASFGSRPGMRRHHWTELELQELTVAYLEHRNQMPLWKIAQMLEFSFSSPKPVHDNEDDHDDHDDRIDTPKTPATPRAAAHTRVPSVQAITSKLTDCVFLETGGQWGYESVKPSQLHCQVWEHVKQSQKHREMIAAMKMSAEATATATKPTTRTSDGRILNVHSREFLYDTAEEHDAAFPPAKRRKIIDDSDDNEPLAAVPTTIPAPVPEPATPAPSNGDELAMREICEALDEIANQIEEREQSHQHINQAVQDSLANIRIHEHQIALLLTTIHDATAEIEIHRQIIAQEMTTIEASFAPAANTNATTNATTNTTTNATSVSVSTSSAASAVPTLGPLAHAANSSFDPNNYQCRECSQTFDPRNGGFWLIGPNRETGDTFYLCRECTTFMEEVTTTTTQQTQQTPTTTATATATVAQRIDEEEEEEENDQECDCGGDCDCWDSDEDDYDEYNYDDEPKQGDYDHSEECS